MSLALYYYIIHIYLYGHKDNQIYVNVFGQAIFQDDSREYVAMVTEDKSAITTNSE